MIFLTGYFLADLVMAVGVALVLFLSGFVVGRETATPLSKPFSDNDPWRVD